MNTLENSRTASITRGAGQRASIALSSLGACASVAYCTSSWDGRDGGEAGAAAVAPRRALDSAASVDGRALASAPRGAAMARRPAFTAAGAS